MGRLNLLTGTLLKEITPSEINGEISVVKSLAFGTYVQVGNLTQSGGVVYNIWSKTIRKVRSKIKNVQSCLILGLGGGSVAKVVRKSWPEVKITGVDIDPQMVSMGVKYLGLDKIGVKVVIEDAIVLLNKKNRSKYDLVCVDLYIGDKYPEVFEGEDFIKAVHSVVNKDGGAVFNRLYYDEKRKQSMKFYEKLQTVFKSVVPIFPEANVMFFCHKD